MALTNTDLKNIKNLMEITFDEKLDDACESSLATKDDIQHLPTKDEFYGKMDEVMGELKAIREEQGILSGLNEKVNEHEDRIGKIEEKLQVSSVL